MKESDIIHQNGRYWVCNAVSSYDVMRDVTTHSEVVNGGCYAKSDNGKSLAIAYADYLAKRDAE